MDKNERGNTKQIHKKEQAGVHFCDESQKSSPSANVLIVDNDQESIRFLLEILARKGICGTVAGKPLRDRRHPGRPLGHPR